MLLRWLTERRRRRLLEQAFPPAWRAYLEEDLPFWRTLAPDEQAKLQDLVQVFVDEKHWEGCGGLTLDDEVRVTIAAQACLLVLHREHELYAEVDSILVYPTTVKRPERRGSVFGVALEPVEGSVALLGEAHAGGPVLLVWDAVTHGSRDPDDGHNVVLHEFAHKIDLLDGGADGTPPLPDREARERWRRVCTEAFVALRERDRAASRALDAYGATNEAEFFAVATERFFERPRVLRAALPELYALLADFYRQDPAAR